MIHCNGSSAVESEKSERRDFHSVLDQSATHLSRLCLMYLFLQPSSCRSSSLIFVNCSFRRYRTTSKAHHSDLGITSLLVHSMHRPSEPRGPIFSFHSTTSPSFHSFSTSLVQLPSTNSTSCPLSLSWRIGLSRALCLGHRCAPTFTFYFLPFLIVLVVLLVCFVRTLGVVAWPCLPVP